MKNFIEVPVKGSGRLTLINLANVQSIHDNGGYTTFYFLSGTIPCIETTYAYDEVKRIIDK